MTPLPPIDKDPVQASTALQAQEPTPRVLINSTQPLESDVRGRLRFKSNDIVRYLLDNGGVDLNQIAMLEFSNDDRQHFAQLIGYSLDGYSELSYVSDDDYEVARLMSLTECPADQVRIQVLTSRLETLKDDLRIPIADLFGIHPDDLN